MLSNPALRDVEFFFCLYNPNFVLKIMKQDFLLIYFDDRKFLHKNINTVLNNINKLILLGV